jgi:hypothetical protein
LVLVVFRLRALPSPRINDFMTASTAASAAAVATAVAAFTSIWRTRATPDLAAPTIALSVFRTKLFLAMDGLQYKGASISRSLANAALSDFVPSQSETFSRRDVLDTAQRRTLL